MAIVDAGVAALLVGRRWRAGSAAAVIVAAGGNVVYAAAIHDGRIASVCGCLGRLVLTPAQHAALSVVVFVLAGWTLSGPLPRAPEGRSEQADA